MNKIDIKDTDSSAKSLIKLDANTEITPIGNISVFTIFNSF